MNRVSCRGVRAGPSSAPAVPRGEFGVKLGLFTITRNVQFVSAWQRIQPWIDKLKTILAGVKLRGRYDNVILTFIDEYPEFFRVIQKGQEDDVYQVNVGYDFAGTYPPDDDVLVIQLLEEKLKVVINSSEGFGEKREALLIAVSDWTTKAIGA